MVPAAGRLDGVGGDADVAVGAVLEADRRRQAAGQLAVHLAFGGARANRAPADQVADVLGRNHVQKLAARHAQAVDVDQQLARDAQAFVDAVAFVQIGSLIRPFQPTVVRAFQSTRITISSCRRTARARLQRCAYSQRRLGVVDGAGPEGMTSRRSSLPCMMRWMARVWVISDSTGVPRMGKKRIQMFGRAR